MEAQAIAFEAAVGASDITTASLLLNELKLAMLTDLPALFPLNNDDSSSMSAITQKKVARQILEAATLLSVKQEDIASFERHIVQLTVFYTDFNDELPPSELQYTILGMRLLHFLVENRMAEFHGALERVPETQRVDVNIAYAIKLEQWLMEGSYSKVLDARHAAPSPHLKPFITKLLETVRDTIAECLQVAYMSLTVSEAMTLLYFDTSDALRSYVSTRKPDWQVNDMTSTVTFKEPTSRLTSRDIPNHRLVQETLTYATELERIV